MDLNQLVVFVRVIEAGSFTKAAALLKQPKSRVSRKISALEKELGVSLLYRTTRHFKPTEAGMHIYNECREHVYALEMATSTAKDNSKEVAGVLKLTASEDMGTALLGPVITEVSALHKKLSVDAYFTNARIDLVKEGFDLAIRIGELKDTTLIAKKIGEVASVLIASPAYLKKSKRIEKVSDLAEHATLHFSAPSENNIWSLKGEGKREEKVRITPVCRASNPHILVQLAVSGMGVSLLPEFLCIEDIEAGRLKRVLPGHSQYSVPVSFVWPYQKETSPKVRAFIDVGMKHLKRYF